MTNIVTLDFKHAQPINLDDQVNLRDIFNVLVEKGAISSNFDYNTWIARKLRYYTENTDYFTIHKKVDRKSSRGSVVFKDHTASVQVAMEIIANGHKEAGYEMRRFMTECIRLAQNHLASPNLSEIDILVRSVGLLAKQQQEIDTLKRDTPIPIRFEFSGLEKNALQVDGSVELSGHE
jgi:phage anti-repressor protein